MGHSRVFFDIAHGEREGRESVKRGKKEGWI